MVDKYPDQTAWARRADVALRAKYPNLTTRIFETTPQAFVIVFDKALQDASAIDVEEVRPVTLQLQIANDVPPHLREIEPIRDADLSLHYEGFPFTIHELFNLVAARFRNLPIADIRDGGSPMAVTIELTTGITPASERELLDYCAAIGSPAPFKISVTGRTFKDVQDQKPKIPLPPVAQPDALFVGASRIRPGMPPHVRVDEEYWFENLDAVCRGQIQVESMPGIEEGDARCFVDATIGQQINFRQLLAYYDTIYFSPPLLQEHQKFLDHQALTEADLLDLISAGRLKLLLTQAEERLNVPFLAAAGERSPTAIVGRRTAAAMLLADIVHTADEFRLNDPGYFAAIGELSRALAAQSGLPADKVLQFLLWPLEARRSAIGPFLTRGSKGVLPIGLGPHFGLMLKKLTGKDLELEAGMVSEKVHIAHAIRATAFPMREEPVGLHNIANSIGDALNFYRSFNTKIAASWTGNVERKNQGKVLLPPLPILEFDGAAPISDVLQATERPVMRNRARALFGRLADMTEEQRSREVDELNASLRRFSRPAGIMSLDTADTAVSVAALAYGFVYPPLAGLGHLAAQLLEIGRRSPTIDKLMEDIGADLFPGREKQRELDFLSRISRVATLKTSKVS